MTTATHLWAIAFDDVQQAEQVRNEITRLGWDEHYLCLLDVAVVERNHDGSFTVDRKPFPATANILGCTATGFLAGLVLAAPLTGALVGAIVGGAGTAIADRAGIDAEFIREVEELMQPGTSALFILEAEGDMQLILHRIRGLGGTVVRTNVNVERAKLIQSTLAAASANTSEPVNN